MSSAAGNKTRRARRTVLEDHYRVAHSNEEKVVLPGVPTYDDDFKRDLHDFFNLIALVPVVILNSLNWDWERLLDFSRTESVKHTWTGEWFRSFFLATMAYFVVDLIWIKLVPRCVKSPSTIIKHHIATLLYILVPYLNSEYEWCMGACMSVEINTWFLIARRIFNKQGFPPWIIKLPPLISIRIKLISILFYVSWVSIRCILYPVLLNYFILDYQELYEKHGPLNVMAIVVPLHVIFCILNFKWSYDLLMSKMRYWRRLGKDKNAKDDVSKGL